MDIKMINLGILYIYIYMDDDENKAINKYNNI